MRHGSLFSGIGGFDLAAQRMGWENVFHCEKEPFAQKILKYYWPSAILHNDITTTDFNVYRGGIDIITGGFPCQPYSNAGKRLGKDDDRHLWPEMLRAIREIKPRWVVGENVRGLISWNGGMVFDEVQADLEAEGYEVLPFLLPAAGVGAPHQRYRLWFVARWSANGQGSGDKSLALQKEVSAYPYDERLQGRKLYGAFDQKFWPCQPHESASELHKIGNWQQFPTQPPVCGGNDGISPRLDGITVSKHRRESIKAYGNAVVPQVVLQIFKAIEIYNRTHEEC